MDRRTDKAFERVGVFLRKRKLDSAQAELDKLLQWAPQHALANNLQGMIAFQKQDYQSAKKLCLAALAADPELGEAYNHLGFICLLERDFKSATEHFLTAIRYRPSDSQAYFNLGFAYELQTQSEQAEACYDSAARWPMLDSANFAQAYVDHGLINEEHGEYAKAENAYRRAIQLRENNPAAYHALSVLQLRRSAYQEAVTSIETLLRLEPNNALAHNNLGVAYSKLMRTQEGEACFRKALTLDPNFVDARRNLAIALQELGLMDAAEVCFRDVLQVLPEDVSARYLTATGKLARGDFVGGWPDYALRWRWMNNPERIFPFTRWRGEDLSGRDIFIYAEQGLGEDIMFGSCVPDLLSQAKHCVVECDQQLVSLFKRSFPSATILGSKYQAVEQLMQYLPSVDYQAATGDLPRYVRRSAEQFPKHDGFLVPDPARVAFWQGELEKLGPGLKVGFSWRGGTPQTRGHLRVIPQHEWHSLLSLPNTHWISLQYNSTAEEEAAWAKQYGHPVIRCQTAMANYDETAALVAALDVIVSTCTAVIHLAGALGKKTYVLVPIIAEWRYLCYGQRMPWYPSVTLLRQEKIGEWAPVIRRAAGVISSLSVEAR